MPKLEFDTDRIKSWLLLAKDVLLEALVYILIGLIIGELIPLVLFLCLLALGFTVAGVSAGSLAACFQAS
jgi:hypothetical protein